MDSPGKHLAQVHSRLSTDKSSNHRGGRMNAADDLIGSIRGRFSTILADPPWQFQNRTGKMAPEHKRLSRCTTMTLQEIAELPVHLFAADRAHLYLWVPNALLPEGLLV